MALFELIGDLSGLAAAIDRLTAVHERIAQALERLSPPVAVQAPAPSGDPDRDAAPAFHLAESPEEYQARTNEEAAFAQSLGFAPWSPDFEATLVQMRADLMKPRIELDEEGRPQEQPAYSKAEADDIVRQAFALAKAQANERREG